MSVPSNGDNNDEKRRKLKEFTITRDHEEIRKFIKNFVARSNNFDSLKESIVRAIYGGEWNFSPEHLLLNEEEVVLDIFLMISEEAYTILSIIPMNKALPAIEHRLELKEKHQKEIEEMFKREREAWK